MTMCESGICAEEIVTDHVEKAMTRLNDKCTAENFNLLEIMLSGRAVTAVVKKLFPDSGKTPPSKGTVVLATLEGDVHDIGKNILKMVLIGKGYRVIDCGKNCSVDKLLEVAGRQPILAIGVSALVTSAMPNVMRLKRLLVEKDLGHIPVLAGGAALKQATREFLRVDFLGETAFDGLDYVDGLVEDTRHNEKRGLSHDELA